MVETQSEIIKTLRKIYAKYDYYVRESRMKVKTDSYLITCILASVIIFVAFLLFNIFFLHIPPNNFNAYKLPLLILFVVADLSISYPYLLTSARIAKIEEALPDALKQMSDTLRAGGTYEFALREISNSNYGPLSEEMELALRGLEEGQNFEQVLKKFSDKTESTLVRRTMTIITEDIRL